MENETRKISIIQTINYLHSTCQLHFYGFSFHSFGTMYSAYVCSKLKCNK